MFFLSPLRCQVTELEEFLAHPMLRNVLMCHLPTNLRRQLMYERRYILLFHALLEYLAALGLVTLGKREFKQKEMVRGVSKPILYSYKRTPP